MRKPRRANKPISWLLDLPRPSVSRFNRRKTLEYVVPGSQGLHVADCRILSCTQDGYHFCIAPILADQRQGRGPSMLIKVSLHTYICSRSSHVCKHFGVGDPRLGRNSNSGRTNAPPLATRPKKVARLSTRWPHVDTRTFRLDRVYALDERLMRKFEKALAMLIKLRELRSMDRPQHDRGGCSLF